MIKAAFLFAFLPALPVSAAPAWQHELSPPALGKHPRLQPVSLDFQLSWKGLLNSGNLRIDFAPPDAGKPAAYVVRSSATSLGAAARLYPYRHHFWSELDPATLQPRYFHGTETDSKETVTYTIRHARKQVASRESTRNHKTGVISVTDKTFAFTPVFDLFSAMLYIRSQPLATSDRLVLAIHPFDTPYLLRAEVLGRGRHDGTDAIRLQVSMQKIDRDTMELRPYKKLKRAATLWLSDDQDRIPLEFRAAVFIGDVRAKLTHRKKL